MRRNLVPNAWTTEWTEKAHFRTEPTEAVLIIVTTAVLVVEERRWRRPDSV